MKKNILITGLPKSGKSTLLEKILSKTQYKVGFLTKEILGDEGRLGFEMETSSGDEVILAHVNHKTPYQVSKYFVDIISLESMIPKVIEFNNDDLLYLDEIGQMQLFSKKFEKLVEKYLNSENISLSTLSQVYRNDFTDSVRSRTDTILVELTENNRPEMEGFVKQLIKKIKKAKSYIAHSELFTHSSNKIDLRSEHGVRELLLEKGQWLCSCEFFSKYHICSHSIATQEIYRV